MERPAAREAEVESRIVVERVVAAQVAGADFVGLAAGCEDTVRARKFRGLAPLTIRLRKL